jgi:hypothetical protein
MDFDRRAAAWLESQLRAHGPIHEIAKRFDFDSASLLVKYVTALGPAALGEHALAAKEMLETVHQAILAVEPALSQLEDAHGEPEAEQVKDEQARVDQQVKDEQARVDQQVKDEQARVDQQAKDEQARVDQQAKDEQAKADAELAAAVIEEQTGILEKQIADETEKSAGEIDALKKDFEREQQELTGKLDGMARNYFDKHAGLSDDQRRDATETFKEIKEEALGELRGNQETRLGELTRAQQEQRGELEERRKELDGTRSDR